MNGLLNLLGSVAIVKLYLINKSKIGFNLMYFEVLVSIQ